MKPYGNQFNFKKKVSYQSKKNSEKISILNFRLIHQIFNTINIALLVSILTLFFLSFDSQRKWSNTYKTLSKTRAINNNLIDYISKTEEFYINKIESLNTFKKATPKDLIYLDKQITQNKNNYLNKKIKFIKDGLKDSKYQKGY